MPENVTHTAPSDAGKLSKLNVPAELHQRARAAVRIVRRATGRQYTISQFVTEAFMAQLSIIARDYNSGQEIYPDTEPLERGRR